MICACGRWMPTGEVSGERDLNTDAAQSDAMAEGPRRPEMFVFDPVRPRTPWVFDVTREVAEFMAGDVSEDGRAEVAEVLAAHRWLSGVGRCLCGWSPTAASFVGPLHNDHVADALAPLLARREAEARAEGVARVRALGESWVGFDDSHGYGDAVLLALGDALAARSDQGGA